jgi:biotin carboxylase
VPRRLYVVAGKVTDSVTYGFLPAADRLGLDVTVLTDRPDEHERTHPGREVVGCDVTDFREIINTVRSPDAIFSNSDHLQAPTALAADYFGLPGKDWRAATRTKNKALMRRHLAEEIYSAELGADRTGEHQAPYPLVLKPREGVASEDVVLVRSAGELAARAAEIGGRRPGRPGRPGRTGLPGGRRPLIVEEYLPGRLHTLETLGDGRTLHVLGSFRTTISPPPYFVEERLEWAPPPAESGQIRAHLHDLGVGFGACHTEFVVHEGRARLIEVNYRIIGDHCDFLLADLLRFPVFEEVLKVHLGAPPREPPPPPGAAGHAIVDYVLATRSGTLTAAPATGDYDAGDVRITYRSVRQSGAAIALSNTNRDYLGTIQAIGPEPAAVESAIARFRADHTWDIT